MRTLPLRVGLFVVSLLAAGCVLAAETVPFPVAEATYKTVDQEEVFDGVIEAVHRATISAQTSGRVIEVNFDVDDYVSKGDVILRIRDTEQKAALAAAQARFEEAQAEFNRIKEVYRKKLVAKSAFDKAQAALKSARASLDQAREQLEHTVVRAPYSGIVVARHIEVGETAQPGQPLMTGISLEQLRATSNVPQRDIAAVRRLLKARVLLPGGRGELPGDKLTISPYADPDSHTFNVRVDLPPGQHGVYPGMFTKVSFVVGQTRRLLVPAAAVVNRSEVTAVYVLSPQGRVEFRQIRTGARRGQDQIEVLAGLEAGERVAVDPIKAGVYLKETRSGEGS
jgi:RND family efflux transporter MFP subunit